MTRWSLFATVAVLGCSLLVPSVSSADPPGTRHCSPGWDFVNIKLRKTQQKVVQKLRVENRTNRKQEGTFTSSKSETVGWSASGKVGGGIDAVIFSVNGEFDIGATKDVTANIGVSTRVTIPKRRTAVGDFGVFRRPVIGTLQRGNKYSRCLVNKRVKVKLPVGAGWRVSFEPL
jgi:hypothetical protein